MKIAKGLASMERTAPWGRRVAEGLICVSLLMTSAGCSAHRPATEEHHLFRQHFPHGGDNRSTLGHDFRAAPRGQTIPASGLGVDLVKETTPSDRDSALLPTGLNP